MLIVFFRERLIKKVFSLSKQTKYDILNQAIESKGGIMKNKSIKLFRLICILVGMAFVIGFSSCKKKPVVNEYNVNFYVDGNLLETVKTSGNASIKTPANPVKSDYEFVGWFLDQDSRANPFNKDAYLNKALTNDINIYASFDYKPILTGTSLYIKDYLFDASDKYGDAYGKSYANRVTSINLEELVTVSDGATWKLVKYNDPTSMVSPSNVNVQVGNNLYQIIVSASNGDTKNYTLIIYRNQMCNVEFIDLFNHVYETKVVEEGSKVDAAASPLRKGFTFDGWNYDFDVVVNHNTRIYAKWVANTYEVTFDANGGTVSINTQSIKYGENYRLPTPTKENSFFDGWYSNDELISTGGFWFYDANYNLKAKWAEGRYNIEYHLNGAETNNNPDYYYVNDATIYLKDPIREGYEFAGWSETEDGTPRFAVSIPMGSRENKVFYAHWRPASYIIFFDANGGNVSPSSRDVTYKQEFILPIPERIGYEFDGWYTADDQLISSGIWQNTQNLNVVAKWLAINYQINYELEDGTFNEQALYQYNIDAPTFMLPIPQKQGYDFLGWTSESITTPVYEISIDRGTTGHLTFTAHWELTPYKIIFNPDGGSCSTTELTVYYDEAFVLPTPLKNGYLFRGWYNDDGIVESGVWYELSDISLKAKYEIIDYKINYVMNYGNNNPENPNKYTVLSNDITLKDPTYYGHTFLGWSITAEGTPNVNVVISNGSYGELTYYAIWEAINYQINYYLDGGINDDNNPQMYNVETPDIIINQPTKKGYTFEGWSYTIDGAVSLQATIYRGSGYDTDLYAHWTANSYKVSFDANGGTCDKTEMICKYDTIVELPTPTKANCIFKGWSYNNLMIDTQTAWGIDTPCTFTAVWEEKKTVNYFVEYYLENANDSGYTIADQRNFSGFVGDEVTPSVLAYEWFESPAPISEEIKDHDATTIKYYYTRNKYEIMVTGNGGSGLYGLDSTSIKHGATISNSIYSIRDGYTFGGFYTDARLTMPFNYIMPHQDLTIYAYWIEETRPTDLEYSMGAIGYSIGGYLGSSPILEIPKYIGGTLVTTIGVISCDKASAVYEVNIPDGVTEILAGALKNFTNLEKVTIPFVGQKNSNTKGQYSTLGHIFGYLGASTTDEMLTSNGSTAQGVLMTTAPAKYCYFAIPQTLREVKVTKQSVIPAYAFKNCNLLTTIIIPEKAVTINQEAFKNCAALQQIVLGTTITTINANAFLGCAHLTIYARIAEKPSGWNSTWNPDNKVVYWNYHE